MKTYKNLFKEVCSFEKLYDAYLKARRGKTHRGEVAKFTYNLEGELLKLQNELENQSYETGRYRNFVIFEPKRREISALPFRDRIVHHAVCAVIEPIFEKTFISDSFACRKGKGTHAGILRMQNFIEKTGENFYALKCDISKYFQSINHEILKKIIRRKIADEKLLWLIDSIIDSSENGVPIGNLTSQLFANIYLSKLDEYIKYELKVRYYIRYMDDFVLLDNSKKFLQDVRGKLEIFLVSISLSCHKRKTTVFPIILGIDFLGYRIYIDYRLARKSTVQRFINRTKKKIVKYENNLISHDKLMESFNSWESYMNHGDTYALKKNLYERYFKNVA